MTSAQLARARIHAQSLVRPRGIPKNAIYREVRLLMNKGKRVLETKQLDGRDHYVFPVVALMEGVIWPGNSEVPELVLASELEKVYGSWDGRPVVMNHPKDDEGSYAMANTPEMLTKFQFGRTFNTKMDDKKLLMEAWLDPEKAKSVDKAVETIERIQNDEMVEVSTGAWVVCEEADGIYEPTGQEYHLIWREVYSDHLAILEEGMIGACSNEMGCGVPRVATVHLLTSRGFQPLTGRTMAKKAIPACVTVAKERWNKIHAAAIKELGQSDINLRTRLFEALEAFLEPRGEMFMGIEAVDPEDKVVTYSAMPPTEYYWDLYSVGYTQDADGKAAIVGEPVEQVRLVEFVAAKGKEKILCEKCGGNHLSAKVEGESMKREDRIKALMANEFNPIKDQKALEANTDEGLRLLEVHCENAATLKAAADDLAKLKKKSAKSKEGSPEEEAEETPEEEAKEDDEKKKASSAKTKQQSKPPTEEEWLSSAPESVRQMVANNKALEADRRKELVGSLKSLVDSGIYTQDELNLMPISQLEKVAKTAKVEVKMDFSGRGLGRTEDAPPAAPPAPPDMGAAIRALRSGKESTATT